VALIRTDVSEDRIASNHEVCLFVCCILLTDRFYTFYMTLRTNTDCFPKEHYAIHVHSKDMICSLCGRN
jgi:hypothetical protein